MKVMSILFYKKFDYIAFPIGICTLLIILVDLFYTTDLAISMLWNQIVMVLLYYFVTRGRAERNFKMKGIEPIIIVSLFGFLVMLFFFGNVMMYVNLIR